MMIGDEDEDEDERGLTPGHGGAEEEEKEEDATSPHGDDAIIAHIDKILEDDDVVSGLYRLEATTTP